MVFAESDIVIMSHGAGNSNAQFLRPHGTIVEITGLHDPRRCHELMAGMCKANHVYLDRCGASVWLQPPVTVCGLGGWVRLCQL